MKRVQQWAILAKTFVVKKGWKYWLVAGVFAFLGWYASERLEGNRAWIDLKYYSYRRLQDLRGGPTRVPQTVLVGIGDEEYYSTELGGRRPLKRDYLAKLITAIAAARPRLVAVDVDLRSLLPESQEADFEAYRVEDASLFAALCQAQKQTRLVVSKAVYDEGGGHLVAGRNIYDGNDVCPIPGGRIAAGHLSLPLDVRRIPTSTHLSDGTSVDSLSLAAVRSLEPAQYPASVAFESLPYAKFRAAEQFRRFDASAVMSGRVSDELEGRIVVILGDWHVLAKDRGTIIIDSVRTPIGEVPGGVVHANLIETLMAAEYSAATPEAVSHALEIIVALWLAILFAFHAPLWLKFLYLAGTATLLTVITWLSLQLFASFFDIIPILASMYLHAVFDQVEEWREDAHHWREASSKKHK